MLIGAGPLGHRDGGDVPAHVGAEVHPVGQDASRSSPTRASRACRRARASATSGRRRWRAGRSASCATATSIEIVIDREHARGAREPGRGRRDASWTRRRRRVLLASRPAHPALAPHGKLPDDTRLWAALQQASGGTWGGCVYDVDRIVEVIDAGVAALGQGRAQGMTARALAGAVAVAVGVLAARPAAAQIPRCRSAGDARGDAGLPDGPPASLAPGAAPRDRRRRRRRRPRNRATPTRSSPAAPKLVWRHAGAGRRRPGTGRTADEPMSARWRSNLYGFVELERDARQHAELRPVVEQRDARAARDVRRPARAHAVHREQLAVRLHAERARLGTAARLRSRRGGLLRRPAVRRHRADRSTRRPSRAHAPLLLPAAGRTSSRARRSICWSASTTTCSRGAAPASTRTASPSSGSRARSITASRRSAGTLSIPLCCVTLDVAAAAVRPVQRDSEVPDVQGGREAQPRTGGGASARRASASPTSCRCRSASRASGAGSRSPSSCPCPASRRSRSAGVSPRTRSSRHPGALADRPQERAVAERGVHDRQRHRRPLHGADRRRAVPDAAQPGGTWTRRRSTARTSTAAS